MTKIKKLLLNIFSVLIFFEASASFTEPETVDLSVSGQATSSEYHQLEEESGWKSNQAATLEDLVSAFNKTFFESARNSAIVGKYTHFQLPSFITEDFFFNLSNFLLEIEGVWDECLTHYLARSVASVGTLYDGFYITSSSNTLSKFLISKGALDWGNVVDSARNAVGLLESYANRIPIRSPENFIQSTAQGVVGYAGVAGFPFKYYYTEIFVIFSKEYAPDSRYQCD